MSEHMKVENSVCESEYISNQVSSIDKELFTSFK